MKLVLKALAVFVAVSLLSTAAFAAQSFTVGVSPGIINLGNLDRETTKTVDFYVTTPSDETILVKLESQRGDISFYEKANYREFISNCSEEDSTSWVSIINNPVEIRPSNDTILGSGVKGKEVISFLLDVPKNAEPGFHVLYISPLPSLPSETIGNVGSRVVAVTSLGIVLNVSGNAIRRGTILNTETGSYVGDRAELKTYFQNTGTVTITAKVTNRIYNESGVIKELSSETQYVKPREIRTFTTYIPKDVLKAKYDVYTQADYTTGTAEKSSSIDLTAVSALIIAPRQEEGIPYALLAAMAAIIIASVIIYRRIK
jgi:hypothetical protein